MYGLYIRALPLVVVPVAVIVVLHFLVTGHASVFALGYGLRRTPSIILNSYGPSLCSGLFGLGCGFKFYLALLQSS